MLSRVGGGGSGGPKRSSQTGNVVLSKNGKDWFARLQAFLDPSLPRQRTGPTGIRTTVSRRPTWDVAIENLKPTLVQVGIKVPDCFIVNSKTATKAQDSRGKLQTTVPRCYAQTCRVEILLK